MTEAILVQTAHRVEQEIRSASGPARDALIAEFSRTLGQLRQSGAAIPGYLRSVEAALEDEATEDQFDNMPV